MAVSTKWSFDIPILFWFVFVGDLFFTNCTKGWFSAKHQRFPNLDKLKTIGFRMKYSVLKLQISKIIIKKITKKFVFIPHLEVFQQLDLH